MPSFNNFAGIEKYLLKVLADCMNEVGGKVDDLLKEHVQKDVYDVGTSLGRDYYHNGSSSPTGQLRDSVTHSKPTTSGNEVSTEVHHDSSQMDYNPDTYLHGSNYWSPNDVRDMLPYLIDSGNTGGLFGSVWEGLRRPYFTNTYNELVSKDLVKKWMMEALKKRGLNVV